MVEAAPDRTQCCIFAMDGSCILHRHHARSVSTTSCSDFQFFGLLRGYNTPQTLEVRASRLVEACVHFGYNKVVNGRGGSHHETGCYRIAGRCRCRCRPWLQRFGRRSGRQGGAAATASSELDRLLSRGPWGPSVGTGERLDVPRSKRRPRWGQPRSIWQHSARRCRRFSSRLQLAVRSSLGRRH
jgi:hypothetical protein